MNNKLRAAVVGVGYLGTFHAQKYKNNPHVQLIGVCDHAPAQADKVASELGVASIHKVQDLVGQVDLVTVAANTQSHYEVAKLLLQNNIHVNVEKPITATVVQGQELVTLAKEKNLTLACGHIERFNPSVLEVKRRLNNPRTIELNRRAPFKARGADVSVLHDLMIHDFDLLRWLSGSEVESFHVSGEKIITQEWDVASVSCLMKNGVHGLINVSRISPTTERNIRVAQGDQFLFANTGAHEFESVTNSGNPADPLKSEKWSLAKADALQSETDAFIQAVIQRSTPVVTGHDGLVALEWIEKFDQALRAR